MKEFYEDYSFILSFIGLTVIFSMSFGDKFTEWFIILVVLSMVIINSDVIVPFLNNSFLKVKKTKEK